MAQRILIALLSVSLLFSCTKDKTEVKEYDYGEGFHNSFETTDGSAEPVIPEGEIDMTPIQEVLGVTHAGGQYCLTDKPFLKEGADAIYELGTKCIKLWFEHAGKKFPYNSQWPEDIENYNSLELAKTPYFQEVFGMPFKVYCLEFSDATVNWKDGLSADEKLKVYNNLYDLAKYFLQTYKGTGKTFIIQNWEGDGHLNAKNLSTAQQPVAIQGMIDWTNTRQAAISQARKDVGCDNVVVALAFEFNYVLVSNNNPPFVIDEVVPKTNCDLYSYSSYSSRQPATLGQIVQRLNYIKTKTPPSELYGEHNLMIGEFGFEERGPWPYGSKPISDDTTGEAQLYSIKGQLDYLLDFGVNYIFYWQIYCNGEVDDSGRESLSTEPQGLRELEAKNLKGYWLIRPDGTKPPVYDYMKSLFEKNELVKAQRPKY